MNGSQHTHTHTQNGLSIPNEKKRRRKLFVAEKTTLVIISAQFHFLYVVVVVRRWASSADGGGRGNDGDCKIQKCPPGFYSSNWNEIQHTYTHRTSTPPSTLHLPSLHCLVGLVRDGMWITCSLCDHISFQHTMPQLVSHFDHYFSQVKNHPNDECAAARCHSRPTSSIRFLISSRNP